VYHAETAKPVKRLPDQADNAESVAKLAAKQAEVEEIFHLSKKGKQSFPLIL
jgi:cystathionine beta-lyase/cystathionine gamma-synthase